MTEDSGFYSLPEETGPGTMELIHRSERGWSELYRVIRDGRFIALKAIKEEFRGQSMYESLLRKEYLISASLQHPYIRGAYNMLRVPGLGNVIELEWIDGFTLEELLEKRSLPRKEALKYADQLCDAVSYLHARQIIHRDIKPSNILVTHNGGNIKLIDFGLSDADSWAELKGSAGTRSFAAPEVLNGAAGDWLSDIWSLGKVISLMLPGTNSAIRRCCSPVPSKRFEDAAVFKSALHRKSPLPAILVALAILTVILLWQFLPLRKTEVVSTPDVPEATAESNEAVSLDNPAVIDELFRQATDIIERAE